MKALFAVIGALVLTTSSAAAATPPRAPLSKPDDVGAALVDLLRRDDVRSLAALTGGLDVRAAAFEDLRTIFDEYDCLTIPFHSTTIESQTNDRLVLRVEAPGTASTVATWRPLRHLPRWWHVEAQRIDGAWRMVRVQNGEHWTAKAMSDAPSLDDAQCELTSAVDVDLPTTIRYYAHEFRRDLARAAQAVRLAEQLEDIPARVTTLRRLAIYRVVNERPREEALEAVFRAEQLARERGTATELAEALFGVGQVYVHLDDRPSAIAPYLEAGALVEQTEEPLRSIKSLHMGAWSMDIDDAIGTKIEIAERIEALSRRYGWLEGEALALHERAVLYHDLRRPESFCPIYVKTLRASEAIANSSFIAHALVGLANCAGQQGDVEKQLALYRRAVQYESPEKPWFEVYLARLLLRLQRHDEAATVLDRAETILQTDGRAELLLARSELKLQQGQAGEAARLARDSARLFSIDPLLSTEDLLAAALIQLGMSLRTLGESNEALSVVREAVAILEAQRDRFQAQSVTNAFFLDDLIASGYGTLVELLLDLGETEAAFRVAESMKARSLRDVIARGRIDLSASLSDAERENERVLSQRIVDLNRAILRSLLDGRRHDEKQTQLLRERLAAARGELETFRTEMVVRHPQLRWQSNAPDHAPLVPEAWASLAIVEYVLTKTSVIAFCATRGDDGALLVRAMRLRISRDELQRKAARLGDLVANRSMAWSAAARELHAVLLAPLEPWLAGKERLCIVPAGNLWRVPFQALLAADGSRVIDRHAVFYSYSLALLQNASEPAPTGEARLLAFGNPTIDGATQSTLRSMFRDVPLGPLLDAEHEVQSLATIYPPSHTRVLVRDAAREAVLKREVGAYDILHIAAHAIVDDGAPMYSAIVLATASDEPSEDGLLEAREIVDLPLAADLAILSACDTARGTIADGEGVIGLTWAFFAAGCPTTVVSQWKAESRATSLLMIEFHRRLVAGDSPAEALRRAQIAIGRRARYSHPFYWAPFVVIGAAERTLRR